MKRFSRIQAVAGAIAVLAVMVAPSAAQQNGVMNGASADRKEIHDYVLTTDKLTRFERAATGVQTVLKDTPGLQDQLNADAQNNAGPNTIAQSVAALDKYPQLVSIIKSNGFSTHEYIVITFVIMNVYTYIAVKKTSPNLPMPPAVSPANVTFIQSNFARVDALVQLMSQ